MREEGPSKSYSSVFILLITSFFVFFNLFSCKTTEKTSNQKPSNQKPSNQKPKDIKDILGSYTGMLEYSRTIEEEKYEKYDERVLVDLEMREDQLILKMTSERKIDGKWTPLLVPYETEINGKWNTKEGFFFEPNSTTGTITSSVFDMLEDGSEKEIVLWNFKDYTKYKFEVNRNSESGTTIKLINGSDMLLFPKEKDSTLNILVSLKNP